MLYFHNDYNETCHPSIIEAMAASQKSQMVGYGEDIHCHRAADLIRQKCGREDLSVHFLVGGTQTNLTVIASALRPYQAVLTAQSGHINVHETGAIEATGHKVVVLPSSDGKLSAKQISDFAYAQVNCGEAEHIVQVKMVYISFPTETGTIYSLSELEQLRAVCDQYGFYLYVDGARLGYGLTAKGNDVTIKALARLCDVFYIGGTKVGAMFGEAVVISNPSIAEDFRYMMKQRGGMLAKGWLLGIQFETLFKDDLYFTISRHANELAEKIRSILLLLGYPLFVQCPTNQVFAVIPNSVLEKLKESVMFQIWETVDESHTVVRFCTSWATARENVDILCQALKNLAK